MYKNVEKILMRLESDLNEWYQQPVDIQLLNKLEYLLQEAYQKGYDNAMRNSIE